MATITLNFIGIINYSSNLIESIIKSDFELAIISDAFRDHDKTRSVSA